MHEERFRDPSKETSLWIQDDKETLKENPSRAIHLGAREIVSMDSSLRRNLAAGEVESFSVLWIQQRNDAVHSNCSNPSHLMIC